ncbi:19094_t:CDS:1, partial [Racocetra fulgida]
WQLEIAVNKKDLYLYSSFSIALQIYIRHQVRKPVAKLLIALEKLSGLLILDSDNLFNEVNGDGEDIDEDNNTTFSLWEPIIMNTKIVNIENIKIPYKITSNIRGLKLPFSRYFMEQINKFKIVYQDDLMMLEGVPDNIDEETGNLKSHIIDDCIKRFSEHITSIVPVLKLPRFKFPNAYFNDFVAIISHGKNCNSKILRQIISHHMRKEVPDPIKLHIFWWDNEDLILTEMQLVLLFPSIEEEIFNTNFNKNEEFNFDDYLLERQSDIMINKFCDIIDNSGKKDSKISRDDGLDDKYDDNKKENNDKHDKGDENHGNEEETNDKEHSSSFDENSPAHIQIKLQHWQ